MDTLGVMGWLTIGGIVVGAALIGLAMDLLRRKPRRDRLLHRGFLDSHERAARQAEYYSKVQDSSNA